MKTTLPTALGGLTFGLTFLIILFTYHILVIDAEDAQAEEEEAEDNDYLYHSDDAKPIQEYLLDQADGEHPDFILCPNNGPRVVEVWATGGPHCQHFRDHYVEFARQMEIVTEEMKSTPIAFHAVSCTVHKKLCKQFNVNGYPRLHLFREGATNTTGQAKYWELHPFAIMDSLGIQVEDVRVDLDAARSQSRKQTQQRIDGEPFYRTKQDVFHDAHLSFDFNLRNGIFTTNEPMSNATKTVFKDWLELLRKALPPAWKIHTVVNGLLDNFEVVTQGENELLTSLDKLPKPPGKKWTTSCTKGKSGMGYTCGLWELFHIITIGTVEWNMMLSEDHVEQAISVSHTADTIRNFVESFFGCEVCRLHFVSAYDACAFDRCNRLTDEYAGLEYWQQLPLWLFETHNAVNSRLLKEQAEREDKVPTHQDELEKQWPSRIDCPKCWRDDVSWDEDTIYKFLRIEYWPEDFIAERYRGEVADTVRNGETYSVAVIWCVGFVAVLGVGLTWFQRRARIAKSGRHKKFDSIV